MNHIVIFVGIAILAARSTLGVEEPTPVPVPSEVTSHLTKSVEDLEKTVGDLEKLNRDWRFWTGVTVFFVRDWSPLFQAFRYLQAIRGQQD